MAEWWKAFGVERPDSTTRFELSTGELDVPTVFATYEGWPGGSTGPSGKPLVRGSDGTASVAEIEIVKRLRSDGWQSAWIDSGGAASWMQRWTTRSVPLPPYVATQLTRLRAAAQPYGRPWDVVAWRGDEIVFVEAMHRRKDRPTRNQAAWLDAAVRTRTPGLSFGVVQWDIADIARPSGRQQRSAEDEP